MSDLQADLQPKTCDPPCSMMKHVFGCLGELVKLEVGGEDCEEA